MSFDPMSIWHSMSGFVKVLTVLMLSMSIYSLYIILERLITFKSASDQSISYVAALGGFLKNNQTTEALASAKQNSKSPVAKVMGSGLSALEHGRTALTTQGPRDVGDFDLVDSVNRALERVKERETSNLRKGLPFLATVASAAPFIGLLGTVIGIISAFDLLKGGGSMDVVGPAIAEALISTAFGLGGAIVAAMGFNYFTARVEHFVVDMNDVSSEFIDFVLREGRS